MRDRPITRILIVESSTYIQKMIAQIQSVESEMQVVGVAPSGEQALQMAIDLQPDVVLLSQDPADMGSILIAKQLLEKSPTLWIIFVMEESPSEQQMAAMIDAGGYDCVTGHPSLDDLTVAIRHAGSAVH
jgi:chemotaxis response regulator CheB